MNLIALALLITALIAFVAFHFLQVTIYTDPTLVSKTQETGWEIWPALWDFVHLPDYHDLQGMTAASAFLTYSLLVVACPFILPFLSVSRLAWWITVIASGVATCGFGGIVMFTEHDPSISVPGPGLYSLLASLALNFLGLLFIRREPVAQSP